MAQLIGWVVVTVAVAVGGWFGYQEFQGPATDELTFTHYKDYTEESISDGDFRDLFRFHQDCFREIKRKYLYRFLRAGRMAGVEGSDDALRRRVDSYILSTERSVREDYRKSHNNWVVRLDGKVIGDLTCRIETHFTDSVMIYNVCIDPALRGKGLGSELIKQAISKCYDPPLPLTLTIYREDDHLMRFYSRLGFVPFTPTRIPPPENFEFFEKVFLRYQPQGPSHND